MSDAAPRPVGVGVIGLGFMGSTHVRAFRAAQEAGLPCRIVAVADRDPARLTGRGTEGNLATGAGSDLFDPAIIRAHPDAASLLADPGVEAVSICTHTSTHVDLAIAALRAGKHVLVEKPVSLRPEEAGLLADEAARHPDLVCMPAMVMRFWPGWPEVREAIVSRRFGPLRSLVLTRRGSTPTWSGFYSDLEACGGALFDLHVHDADFILWALGEPNAVCSTGDLRHVTTIYRYDRTLAGAPVHVVAEGGTDHDPGHGFHIRLTAVFDTATIDFDLHRDPAMLVAGDGRITPMSVESQGPFDLEIRAFINACALRLSPAPQPVPIDDAVRVVRLLDAERRSLQERREIPTDREEPPPPRP